MNGCKRRKEEVDESESLGNHFKANHSAYLDSLGGEDQYSS
ncbi:MAG TPA: hypothetical protein VGJ42_02400 [Nitrososphaera sp.]